MKQYDRFFDANESPLQRAIRLQLQFGDIAKVDTYRIAYKAYLREQCAQPIGFLKSCSISKRASRFPYRTDAADILRFADWLESDVDQAKSINR